MWLQDHERKSTQSPHKLSSKTLWAEGRGHSCPDLWRGPALLQEECAPYQLKPDEDFRLMGDDNKAPKEISLAARLKIAPLHYTWQLKEYMCTNLCSTRPGCRAGLIRIFLRFTTHQIWTFIISRVCYMFLATPVREIMLRDRQDDNILQQLLPATVPQDVDLTHPASEWDHVPLRQLSKSVSPKNPLPAVAQLVITWRINQMS